jgi:hypothetical protein
MIQVKTRWTLREHGGFARIEKMESLMRFWHITGLP